MFLLDLITLIIKLMFILLFYFINNKINVYFISLGNFMLAANSFETLLIDTNCHFHTNCNKRQKLQYVR